MILAQKAIRIAIIGARDASAEGLDFAYKVGQLLGQMGVVVYTGGAGGVMEAASKGVQAGGGIAVGILKESDLSLANDFLNIPVMTGMGDLRNGIIIRSVHGAIAVEGGYGTLSEAAYTLGYEKPLVGFRSWDIPGMLQVETPREAVDSMMNLIQDTKS